MQQKFRFADEEGQGLVEYGLVLVLVSIAAVVAMGLLGEQINTAFTQVEAALSGSSVESVSAARTGGGSGNAVQTTVTVSSPTNITVTDSQSGGTRNESCSGTCTVNIGGVGPDAGTIEVTDGLVTFTVSYEART